MAEDSAQDWSPFRTHELPLTTKRKALIEAGTDPQLATDMVFGDDDEEVYVGPIPDVGHATPPPDEQPAFDLVPRTEWPFSDVVLTPGTSGKADDVRLRDLDLMVDCPFCKLFGQRMRDCLFCSGTGDMPTATLLQMREAYVNEMALRLDEIASHPTVVNGSPSQPLEPKVSVMMDLRDALTVAVAYHRAYRIAPPAIAMNESRRLFSRCYVHMLADDHFAIFSQPRSLSLSTKQNETLTPVWNTSSIRKVEDYLAYHYQFGRVHPEHWRALYPALKES